MRAGADPDPPGELAADLGGDVCKRTKRTRRDEWVARPLEDAGVLLRLGAERAHERGLADSRLAADEPEPPQASERAGECLPQSGERGLALEQRRRVGYRPSTSPSRLAAATASPRDETSSLRRIEET